MSSDGSMMRHLSSPPAPLPDDDDLLCEIFLRLPPRPSSLPRASLVCKRWGRLVSDPQFLRRFSAFHGRRQQQPPLLGFFVEDQLGYPSFTPTLDPPDRVPSARLSLQAPRRGDLCYFHGFRHGLALIHNKTRHHITLWHPVDGSRRSVAVPQALFDDADPRLDVCNAALLCDGHHAGWAPLDAFKVVLLRTDDVWADADPRAFASLYDPTTGVWGDLISTSITAPLLMLTPSVLVGNSLCWLLRGYENTGILVFDLATNNLAQINAPVDEHITGKSRLQILRMEDSGLGLAVLSGVRMQLWEGRASSNGSVGWTLLKTIQLNQLLSLRSPIDESLAMIHGYDEDGHVIFVSIDCEVFMIELKSMQFKNLFRADIMLAYHPYRSFCTRGSDDVGANILNRT
ncbi:unnamed protein product [Urochloa humidicola]